MSIIKHFATITKHKCMVMKSCFRVGLYRQGLLHDLSKYSFEEFMIGANYYQGKRSPNDAEREEHGYSSAWLHHKGRNKHHYEYWMDYSVISINEKIVPVEMPIKYVIEMFLDRVAASKVYEKEKYTDSSAYEYFMKGNYQGLMHVKTHRALKSLLMRLKECGEKETYSYIKKKAFLDEYKGI